MAQEAAGPEDAAADGREVLLSLAWILIGLVVQARPMSGPFAKLDDVCRSWGEEASSCKARPAPSDVCGAKSKGPFRVSAPFLDARVVFFGGHPGTCDLALRTARGWYITAWDEGAPTSGYLTNTDRYMTETQEVGMATDHGVVLYRAVFVHWTAAEKMPWLEHARFESWYECEERILACAMGRSGKPSCAGPFPIGYTTYCRAEDAPTKALRIPVAAADFHHRARVVGRKMIVEPEKGTLRREGPLPGTNVTALGADATKGVRRQLPEAETPLEFP